MFKVEEQCHQQCMYIGHSKIFVLQYTRESKIFERTEKIRKQFNNPENKGLKCS